MHGKDFLGVNLYLNLELSDLLIGRCWGGGGMRRGNLNNMRIKKVVKEKVAL